MCLDGWWLDDDIDRYDLKLFGQLIGRSNCVPWYSYQVARSFLKVC